MFMHYFFFGHGATLLHGFRFPQGFTKLCQHCFLLTKTFGLQDAQQLFWEAPRVPCADPTDPSCGTAHGTGHVAGDRDGPELLWSGLILVPWDDSGGDQEFMSAVGNCTLEIKRSFGLLRAVLLKLPPTSSAKVDPEKKLKTTHFHMQKGSKGLHVLLWFVHVSTPRRVSILSSWIYPLTLYIIYYIIYIAHWFNICIHIPY